MPIGTAGFHDSKRLKERISTHGALLRQNETRTRTALINPLLQALDWDTSDPLMVISEYSSVVEEPITH